MLFNYDSEIHAAIQDELRSPDGHTFEFAIESDPWVALDVPTQIANYGVTPASRVVVKP